MNTSRLLREMGRGALLRGLHHSLAAVGLMAVTFFLMQGGAKLVADASGDNRAKSFGQIRYDLVADVPGAADSARQRALASYLSKRYRVAQAATEQLVGLAFDTGQQVGLDPLLILAVMAVESRFNPIAESEFGAKGLMQVIPKHHQDKLEEVGGEQAMLDPMTNVLVGSRILKEYIRRTGSLESGLQFYNGALADTTSQYAQKVIAEQERFKQAIQRDRPVARASSV
jgi:hypothetical protein